MEIQNKLHEKTPVMSIKENQNEEEDTGKPKGNMLDNLELRVLILVMVQKLE